MKYDLVGIIHNEIMDAINEAPTIGERNEYVSKTLEKILGDYDWGKSFSKRQVLVFDAQIFPALLEYIHNWLRTKCLDIENIYIVTTHHRGINKYWRRWCELFQCRSFQIKELLITNTVNEKCQWHQDYASLPSLDFFRENKEITNSFSYYGGGWRNDERDYLVLKMLEFADTAEIDYLAKFSDKENILAYTENITYFKNQPEIDYISEMYDRYVGPDGKLSLPKKFDGVSTQYEKIDYSGTQWKTDKHCFASIVRETNNSTLHYSCLTEKTLRVFLHHSVVIPLGFDAVVELENLGFWMPHDIIDYSYQNEPMFIDRVNGAVSVMRNLLEEHTFSQLQQYYIDNIDRFQYNAELVNYHIKMGQKHPITTRRNII